MSIKLLTTETQFKSALSLLSKMKELTFDIETTSLSPFEEDSRILTLAVGNNKKVFVFPVEHKDAKVSCKLDRIIKVLVGKKLIAHNMKFELKWLLAKGFDLTDFTHFDTMIAHHVLNETAPHGLEFLVKMYMPIVDGYWDKLGETMEKKNEYETAPIDILMKYNGYDVLVTHQLYVHFRRELVAEKLDKLYYGYFNKIIKPITYMEYNGFKVDESRLLQLETTYKELVVKREKEIRNTAGLKKYFVNHKKNHKKNEDFNFTSHPQKSDLFYGSSGMKLPVIRRTKINKKTGGGGAPSTDEVTLRMFIAQKKFVSVMKALINRNKANTIITSFINVWKKQIVVNVDGFLRTNYNIHVVETYRLSSSKPNLQSMPTSSKLSANKLEPIKQVIVSRFKNGRIIQADYSQIELRIAGILSGDEEFCDAFNKGIDLHGTMAKHVYGDNWKSNPDNRQKAKRCNFSAVFDISARQLAEDLEIDEREASDLLDGFRILHPTLFDWFGMIWNKAQNDGFITNPIGMKRRITEDLEEAGVDMWQVDEVRRQVWNFPIQSSAAYLTLSSLERMSTLMKDMDSIIIGSVHDSVIFDCTYKEHKKMIKLIKQVFETETMKNNKWITLPIKVDVAVGKDLHKV